MNKMFNMNKKIKTALLFFILVTIILASLYTYRRLNLIIREDIILEIKENYESVWLEYGQKHYFNTEVDINNYWLCTAICKEQITDVRSGEKLLNETFYVTNNKKKSESVEIKPPRGYGQSIYQYKIECRNIPSKKCPTNNETYVRKKTLILNYEPSDYQKFIISQAISFFTNISSNIANSERNIDNATNIMYNIDVKFPTSLKEDALKYHSTIQNLRNSENQILNYWDNDDYEQAYDLIINIYNSSEEILENTSLLLEEVNEIVNKHNTIVKLHRKNMRDAEIIREMLKYYPGSIDEFKEDAMTSLALVNINTIKMNKLEDYDILLREAQLEESNINNTMGLFDYKTQNTRADYVDLYLADALSCTVLGCNQTPINYSLSSIDDIKNRCELYDNMLPRFIEAHNITNTNRITYNGTLQYFDIIEKNYIISLLDIINPNLEDRTLINKIWMYKILLNQTIINQTINITINISALHNMSNYTKLYSLDFKPMLDSLENISVYCNRQEPQFSFEKYIVYEQLIPELDLQLVLKNITMPVQKCCFFGKCTECGSNKKNPIILLHGHSFNQKNSAYHSTDIFNQIEPKLEAEGYIGLGIWTFNAEQKNKILENVFLKPTYYITTYNDIFGTNTIQSKDESIEEYSDRLKIIVDNIKNVTNSDKVDIVAHSMGGLVARRYIQKYGSNDVGKLIMIGTPNHGITDRIHSLCKVFGNEKECDEMHQGSEFIKVLNNNYTMPETYLIIGKGCDMQGKDGDGVVTIENAVLNNYKTYYVNGECSGSSLLHNSMLKREDVIERIINIIK